MTRKQVPQMDRVMINGKMFKPELSRQTINQCLYIRDRIGCKVNFFSNDAPDINAMMKKVN